MLWEGRRMNPALIRARGRHQSPLQYRTLSRDRIKDCQVHNVISLVSGSQRADGTRKYVAPPRPLPLEDVQCLWHQWIGVVTDKCRARGICMVKIMKKAIKYIRLNWKQMWCRHNYQPMDDGSVFCRKCDIVFPLKSEQNTNDSRL